MTDFYFPMKVVVVVVGIVVFTDSKHEISVMLQNLKCQFQ